LLGKGGQGVVYLVRHLLNGEALGLYACKKSKLAFSSPSLVDSSDNSFAQAVPVGDSTLSLLRILREVHLLEAVQHPNIISYHHAWLETSTPATFSPAVPTLYVLMQFANGGSLSDFVNARGGSLTREADAEISLEEKKKRFRNRRKGGASGRAVHLLKVEDILRLFGDVVLGLSFLHSRNILHLDLKVSCLSLHQASELPAV
jgi:serine/threonine protein kinase